MPQNDPLGYLPPGVQAALFGFTPGVGSFLPVLPAQGDIVDSFDAPANAPASRPAKRSRKLSQQQIDREFSQYGPRDLMAIEQAIKQGGLPPEYDEQFVRNAHMRRKQQLQKGL